MLTRPLLHGPRVNGVCRRRCKTDDGVANCCRLVVVPLASTSHETNQSS